MIHGVRALVVSGAPSSGKTELQKAAERCFGDLIMMVPEAPTWLLEKGGWPMPPHDGSPASVWRWQRAVYEKAYAFEEGRAKDARKAGVKLLICDRGVVDGAAYVDGGMDEFCQEMGIPSVQAVLRRYDRALYLGSLAVDFPELYSQQEGNDHRLEGAAEEAAALCARTWEVYRHHPNVERIPAHRDGSAHKIERGLQVIEEMLGEVE